MITSSEYAVVDYEMLLTALVRIQMRKYSSHGRQDIDRHYTERLDQLLLQGGDQLTPDDDDEDRLLTTVFVAIAQYIKKEQD